MIRFLKHNDGAIPLFAALILLAHAVVRILLHGLPVYSPIFNTPETPWIAWSFVVASILLSFLVLFFANRIFQQFTLLARLSNLPLFLSTLALCAVPESMSHPKFWISMALILAYLNALFGFMNGESPKQNAFWSGVALGVSAWFFRPVLFFSIMFLHAGFSSGMLNFRRLIIFIVGFVFPTYLAVFGYYLIADNLILPTWLRIDWSLMSLDGVSPINLFYVIFTYFLVIYSASTTLKSCTIREKRRFQLMVGMSILALFAGFLNDVSTWISLSIIPFGVVFSRLFMQLENKWIREGVFGIFLLLILSLNL